MAELKQKEDLSELVREIVGTNATVEVLRPATKLIDSTTILRIDDRVFRCVLQISPAALPDVVKQACTKAKAFANAVGLSLASAMLLPIAEGRHQGRSFAILPYRRSFSRNKIAWRIQRGMISPAVLDWLAGLAGRADVRNDNASDTAVYRDNFRALISQEGVNENVRKAAEIALDRLERQELEPRICPMHGDLWLGNILRAPPGFTYPFSVIDWGGSSVRGYPAFDLVRLASSYRLGPGRLARELVRHADAIGCSTVDTHSHLLAALGHFTIHRGEMPLPKLIGMVHHCDETHRQAMAS
jgi:aminoglycoside phosphotransferase (APT) family kinase protein